MRDPYTGSALGCIPYDPCFVFIDTAFVSQYLLYWIGTLLRFASAIMVGMICILVRCLHFVPIQSICFIDMIQIYPKYRDLNHINAIPHYESDSLNHGSSRDTDPHSNRLYRFLCNSLPLLRNPSDLWTYDRFDPIDDSSFPVLIHNCV
jgi:hypothetical protein